MPRDCENLLLDTPHAPVVRGHTDARVAYEWERGRLDISNADKQEARECLRVQRESFAVAR